MAIELTWKNIGVLVMVVSGLMVAFFSGTGAMMEWRIRAIQGRLDDRMTLYQREVSHIEHRLDQIERQQQK